MTQIEQKKETKIFVHNWTGHGYEKGESQKFWIDLLANVFGVKDFTNYVYFENQVKEIIKDKKVTNFIDIYIPSTKVMIEQKSSNKLLTEPIKQSDGSYLTPYEQAKHYVSQLPVSQHPKWIIACNFKEFLVYDMENPNIEPEKILLENLEKEFYRLQFIIDIKNEDLKKEMEISLKAGELVGKLYDSLLNQYEDTTKIETLCSLNMLCVRFVFCFYAEDAGLFAERKSFSKYIKSFEVSHVREGLIKLFKALDTKIENRDKYDDSLKPFPYINGGLFKDENIEIPRFTQEMINIIVQDCAEEFDWSGISPTIFGAVFESTLNPQTRRSGGMHYTSIENIHKVIDPLFFLELNEEFEKILQCSSLKTKNSKLEIFQDKLASIIFLDPACGSGNFLTETYTSLRRLENKVIKERFVGQKLMLFANPIKVSISQFFGIEINDFAVTVAKTALWIAESQMLSETENIVEAEIKFFPLKTNAGLIEGDALKIKWESILPQGLSFNYIIGNPPFVGARLMSTTQKESLLSVFGNDWKNAGNLDFVSAWYKKCADLIKETNIKCALVSTNSICQGESVFILWKRLFANGVKFDFAYRTFRWDSESSLMAHVHCIILGFSDKTNNKNEKFIFDEGGKKRFVNNINGYLVDAPNVFIENRKTNLCNVSEMVFGNMANDGGNFILNKEEYEDFIKKEPNTKKYIHSFLGSEEFINSKKRYCLWLDGITPSEIKRIKFIADRVQNVQKLRSNSKRNATKKLAEIPHLFGEIRQPKEGNYLLVPRVSSEKRRYVPIGFLPHDVIASDAVQMIPNATLYEFGIITSNVHMAWMRTVCGRLEMRYRYSKNIVYNNFPWPTPTEEEKQNIMDSAQKILDVRLKFSDSCFADLYDNTFMPKELREAHRENDKAVMQAYGFPVKITESNCVSELFKLYEKLSKKKK